MAGLTDTGFEIKTLEEIKAEIESVQLENIDPNLNQNVDSALGQLTAIISSKIREVWELVAAVYTSAYPDTASGQPLSYIAAITGTLRRSATASTVIATINLDDSVTIPAGSAASVAGNTDMRYEFAEDFTNSTGSTDDFDVELIASTLGSGIRANAGTLTVIATPVTGWNSVTNAADSIPGLDIETDTELRARREQELTIAGSGTVNAIRADVLSVEDVESATVFENVSELIDANGLPGHSFEVVVLGGDDTEIAEQIFESKPAGIQAFGTTQVVVEDTAENEHTIGFSRPVEITIHIEYDLVIDPDTYAGDTAVKEALADFGDALLLGEDVKIAKLNCVVIDIAGVLDITAVAVDDEDPPVATTNFVIGSRQLAVIDTANIDITTTP